MDGPGLRYTVDLAAADHHLVDVSVTIPVAAAGKPGAAAGQPVHLTMPAWCPGSYLIREYARWVRDVSARGDDGQARPVRKLDKATWAIEPDGAAELTVTYRLYGHELSVRTNHVDASHAFLHGPATFAFVPELRGRPVAITVRPPPGRGWRLATGLDGGALGPAADVHELTAPDVDALLDAPIHLGHVEEATFTVADVPFELAIWGERVAGGAFTLDRLVADLTAIATDHATRVCGDQPLAVPFDRYTFVLMLGHAGYGGLEHRASSANLHTPACLATRKSYEGLLELLSHELFHAWNGKRIAPGPLTDVDYSREAYTRCLWVVEGITSHYDRWALRSSRVVEVKSFADKVLDDWVRLQAVPGRHRHSLEDSSFDAWIKLYRPDESNLNTTVSYYLKGGLAALTLDLAIRRRTADQRSLDDVLRALWQRFGREGRPYPEDLEAVFAEAAGLDVSGWFERVVRGTDDPELIDELLRVGIELRADHEPAHVADGAIPVWLGLTTSGTRVTGVLDGSPADAAGLSPGDELAALDRFRVTSEAEVRAHLAARRPDHQVVAAVWRRHRLVEVPVTLVEAPPTRYELITVAEPDADQAGRYRAWLGEDPVAGQSLATVTTASRWL